MAPLSQATTDEPPQLTQVIEAVRRRDEPAAGTKDARQLGEPSLEIGDVVEHPVGNDNVERCVLEGQVLHVPLAGVDTALARELDHSWREIDRDNVHTKLDAQPLRELAPATADLEHVARGGLADSLERQLARIRAGDGFVNRSTGT